MQNQPDVKIHRKSKETDVTLHLNLQGTGDTQIEMELFFLRHMLESFATHGQLDLKLTATGDDDHHLIEDVGIALGQAIRTAVSDSKIVRIADVTVPMDDALVLVALDLIDRPYAAISLPESLYKHMLRSMALEGKFTLHVQRISGRDEHHIIEAAFKGLGRALRRAAMPISSSSSTKGEVEWS